MGCILRNPISDTRAGGCSYVLAIEINYFDVLATEGVVRAPSALGITTGSPPSMKDTQLLVVPKSMPMILLMKSLSPLHI